MSPWAHTPDSRVLLASNICDVHIIAPMLLPVLLMLERRPHNSSSPLLKRIIKDIRVKHNTQFDYMLFTECALKTHTHTFTNSFRSYNIYLECCCHDRVPQPNRTHIGASGLVHGFKWICDKKAHTHAHIVSHSRIATISLGKTATSKVIVIINLTRLSF